MKKREEMMKKKEEKMMKNPPKSRLADSPLSPLLLLPLLLGPKEEKGQEKGHHQRDPNPKRRLHLVYSFSGLKSKEGAKIVQ